MEYMVQTIIEAYGIYGFLGIFVFTGIALGIISHI